MDTEKVYKNAGFTDTEESRNEALHRMINGEIFYRDTSSLYFDKTTKQFVENIAGIGAFSITMSWFCMKYWVEQELWTARLSNENPT